MYRLLFRLFLVAVVAGIALGIIEVKVHFDKIGGAPQIIQQAIGSGSFISQGEYYLTTWKRKAEIAFASTDEKKFEVHMKHVEIDTKTLKDALDAKKGPDVIIVRSKLLNESLNNAKETVEDISDEALRDVRDNWVKVLANANHELSRLTGLADEYKKYQEEIEKIAPLSSGPLRVPSTSPKIELKF